LVWNRLTLRGVTRRILGRHAVNGVSGLLFQQNRGLCWWKGSWDWDGVCLFVKSVLTRSARGTTCLDVGRTHARCLGRSILEATSGSASIAGHVDSRNGSCWKEGTRTTSPRSSDKQPARPEPRVLVGPVSLRRACKVWPFYTVTGVGLCKSSSKVSPSTKQCCPGS